MIKNIIKITIFLLAVFLLAISVWYSTILLKGYTPHQIGGALILSRNLAQTGIYGMENDLNVVLSSNLIKEQGHTSSSRNKLTVALYGKLFELTGPLKEKNLIWLSMALYALILVILALIVLYLFGFKISGIFSLIYILLPFNWQMSYLLSNYEFALLFFSLFFLFYFGGIKQKHNYIYLGLSGIFLVLSCLAKDTFFLFIPFFFFFLWWKNQKRYLLYIFIPFIILFSCLWLPDALTMKNGGNTYLLHFTSEAPEELKSSGFGRYCHLFPDPYTYHFNKEEFLQNHQNQLNDKKIDFYVKKGLIKNASNAGIRTPGLLERIKVGLILSLDHLSRFFSLEDIGGPFVSLLMILGIYTLRRKNKELYQLSLGWIFSVIFLLSFAALAGRNHLMDFGWILALWITLGIVMLVKIINEHFCFSQIKSKILLAVIVLTTLYGLLLANHTAWNTLFDQDQKNSLRIKAYSQKIEELNISDEKVIACPLRASDIYRLNYLTNKSLVAFQEKTIKDLLDNGELNSAFEKFEIRYILGYSDELSKKIIEQSQVVNIADNSVEFTQIKPSPNKIWLLNIIR